MAKVSGIWNFYDIISALPTTSSYNVNFYSNDTQYIGIRKSGGVLYYIASGNVWNAIYDYNDNKWHKEAYKTINFGDTEQDVNNVFYSWIFSNTTKSVGEIVAEIKYGSSILGRLIKEQKATLTCIDQKMLYDVVVSFVEAGTITYNRRTREVEANKVAKLTCANKTMGSNVIIETSEVVGDVAGLFDANGNSVATWTQLESTYGLLIGRDYTSANYKTEKNSLYKVIEDNTILSSGSKLKISDKVSYIGAYSVAGYDKLIEITIPNSVTSIGNGAFSGCTALKSITIPDSVTSIGNMAFHNCSGLKGVYITDLTAWCNIVFGNQESNPVYFAKNLYLNNEIVKNLVIPNTITEIKSYAFAYCSALKSITIPDSVTSIGNMAFWGCTNSTTVTIGNSVTSIGSSAFAYNYVLTTVTINAITPPTLASDCFNGNTKITAIYVPDSAVDTYKGWTNWSAYAGKIKPLSEKV